MREILFRGERVDNGEWVEGELLHKTDGKPYIFTEDDFAGNEVLPETVGQWTGLYDKSKARIWEGDVVNFDGWKTENPFLIEWDETNCGFVIIGIKNKVEETMHANDVYEVVGTIHDTPSLLNDKT